MICVLVNMLPESEAVHFNGRYPTYDGQHAGFSGFPIFVDLSVGVEGMTFGCKTVSVLNTKDQQYLQFLDSDVFKAGLHLVEFAQPTITPLAELTVGLTKLIENLHRNVGVQSFTIGLDFSDIAVRTHLAEGSYIPCSYLTTKNAYGIGMIGGTRLIKAMWWTKTTRRH